MPLQTCVDMVTAALLTAGVGGVGQTPLAEDINTGFDLLTEVIGEWSRERFMAWRNVEEVIPSTGAQSYVLADRPPRLDACFARMEGPVVEGSIHTVGALDYTLSIINSQSEYAEITLKELGTFPVAVWYSPDYPFSSVYPWPVPPANQFDLHVLYRAGLPIYTELTDPLNLPPEYVRCLRYELALLIQLNYGLPGNPQIAAVLAGTKANLKATNARMRNAQMPSALVPANAGQGGISGIVGPHQSVIVPG